jgi:predicted secreted protein
MRFQSALSIYALFWVMSFFLVLPFGVRTDEEAGAERQPGHAESSPHRFSFAGTALRATILSAGLFTLFYLNYVYGWIGVGALDWASPPDS